MLQQVITETYINALRMAWGHGRILGPLKGLFNAPYFEFMRNLRMAHVLPNPCDPGLQSVDVCCCFSAHGLKADFKFPISVLKTIFKIIL